MKKLKTISRLLGIVIAIFVAIGVAFTTIYKDKVKTYIITQINKGIDTKIDVKEVEFSVFKKFPYASLEFKKISAEEITKKEKKEKLFSAQSVYLKFNILDILNENYIIKKIHIDDGMINIKIDKSGNNNYEFWKKSNNTESQLVLELERLTLKNVNFYILNEYKGLDMDIEAVGLTLSGNFSKDEFSLNTQANLMVHQINYDGESILNNKNIVINTTLAVNQITNIYKIKKGEIALEKLKFNLNGNIINKAIGIELDIVSKGEGLAIKELFSLFPKKQKEALSAYKTKGEITYSSSIKGELSAKKTPGFDANFSIANGIITEKYSDQSLKNLSVTGSFTNGNKNSSKSSQLNLNELNADFGAGHTSGNYVITNFANPYIELESKANIDLAMAKEFFKIDSLEIASGNLEINIIYDGYIKELGNIKATELRNLNANGTAKLTNGNLKLTDNDKHLKNINGVFNFNNNDVKIRDLKFELNKSQFELNGEFKNLLAFLFIKEEQLAIRTNFYTNKLVLDDLLTKNKEGKSDGKYTLSLPKDVTLNFTAKIDTFQFRTFLATNFQGQIQLSDKVLSATDVFFNAIKGKVTGNIALDDSKANEILITSKLKTENVDIHELFYQFENFGQKAIEAKNIKGIATTNIEFASIWDKEFNVNKDKIYLLADISIAKGELVNYKPLLAMSKYIEVEELERIKFNSLITQIEVKNQTLHIPKTEIKSTALDLTFSGTHTFNNEMDYHFKLLMSDVLWNKAKKGKKENSEFGYIEDDGLGKTSLFLHLKGTMDDYKVSYDTKGLKESFKEDLKKEKTTLKTILKKEFGWFKKDTTLKKEEEKKDDGLSIEWEEAEEGKKEDKKTESKKTTTPKKRKKKKGLGKFIDKIAEPEAEEFEEFDDI
ncbi:MAG: AsmA-like C-terminal region-containing protein [Flavobacteriales bacterium]